MALNLLDITSNDNDLTNSGMTEYTASTPFAASTIAVASVYGSHNYLKAADSTSLSFTAVFTCEGWFNFDNLPANNAIYTFFSKLDVTNNEWQFFIYNDAGVYTARAVVYGNAKSDYYKWTWTPTVETWYHLAFVTQTSAESAGTFEFFVDGVSQGNGTAITAENVVTINSTSVEVYLGSVWNGAAIVQEFDGRMDDLRIWNDIRTQSEIDTNKSIRLVGNEAGLVAYWPFEVLGGGGFFNFM